MNNIELQREIAQLQVTIQGLGAANTELRKKLAEEIRISNLRGAKIEELLDELHSDASECSRSHPHENMTDMCVLRTEIARLNNHEVHLKAQLSAAKQEGYEQGKQEQQVEHAKTVAMLKEFNATERQAGRDEVLRELSEKHAIGYVVQDQKTLRPAICFAELTIMSYDDSITVKDPIALIIRPSAPLQSSEKFLYGKPSAPIAATKGETK